MDKNFAKVRLSAEEMRLVTDPAWILTKNSVMGKVVAMFAGLSEGWKAMREENKALPSKSPGMLALNISPMETKISRGENYRGLPWVMLDGPREFSREDVLAIRTFFLWGHAFSVTLHLKGMYQDVCLPGIIAWEAGLAAAGFELGVSANEWEHAHLPEYYRPWKDVAELEQERPFLKLSAHCPLQYWDEAPERLSGLYSLLLMVISTDVDR
jgi:hypothetical protein